MVGTGPTSGAMPRFCTAPTRLFGGTKRSFGSATSRPSSTRSSASKSTPKGRCARPATKGSSNQRPCGRTQRRNPAQVLPAEWLVRGEGPPWRLQIIARSGFRTRVAQSTAKTGRASDRDEATIDSRIDALTASSARVREQRAAEAKARPIVATQAVVRDQSADAAESPRSDVVSSTQPREAIVPPSAGAPKRDEMVQRAGVTEEGMLVAAPPVESTRAERPIRRSCRRECSSPLGRAHDHPSIYRRLKVRPRSKYRTSRPDETTVRRTFSRCPVRTTK